MKHTIHFLGILLTLVILGAPRADALVGTVYNGALNKADVNRDGSITAADVSAFEVGGIGQLILGIV